MEAELKSRLDRRAELLDRIRDMLVDKLSVPRERDEIDPDALLFGGGLELDSIDAVDLLVHMSADFGVDLPNDYEGRVALRTVNSLVDLALAADERAHEPG